MDKVNTAVFKPDRSNTKDLTMNQTMSKINRRKTTALAAMLLSSSGLCPLSIQEAAAAEPQLEKIIQGGKALFIYETFEGNGRNCQSCHVDGGVGPGNLPDGTTIPNLSNAAKGILRPTRLPLRF